MAQSCTISEIKRDIGRKSRLFHAAPAFDASVIGVSVIVITFGKKKLDWLGYETVRNV